MAAVPTLLLSPLDCKPNTISPPNFPGAFGPTIATSIFAKMVSDRGETTISDTMSGIKVALNLISFSHFRFPFLADPAIDAAVTWRYRCPPSLCLYLAVGVGLFYFFPAVGNRNTDFCASPTHVVGANVVSAQSFYDLYPVTIPTYTLQERLTSQTPTLPPTLVHHPSPRTSIRPS